MLGLVLTVTEFAHALRDVPFVSEDIMIILRTLATNDNMSSWWAELWLVGCVMFEFKVVLLL